MIYRIVKWIFPEWRSEADEIERLEARLAAMNEELQRKFKSACDAAAENERLRAVMRAGRIEQIGAPQDVHDRPANEYVAEFLGMRNRLACEIDESGSLQLGKTRLDRVFEGYAPGAYALRTRPSQLALRPVGQLQQDEARRWLSGATIIERLPGGETMDYLVDAQGTTLFVESRDARRFNPGEPVDIGFDPRLTLLYDVSGVLAPVR